MSQISFVDAYSINPYNNVEMKKRYIRHKNKIQEISKKQSQFSEIQHQQKRISEVVHRSKELARKFHVQEFNLRKSIENKRMISHLSRFQHRQHNIIEQAESALINRKKTNTKEAIMRHFQIDLEDKRRSEHLQQFSVNKKKYRRKIQQEIIEYQKLKNHMQRFKNSRTIASRSSNRETMSLNHRSKKNQKLVEPVLFGSDRKTQGTHDKLSKSKSLPPLSLAVL